MTDEIKQPARNLERISERKFSSYETAKAARDILTVQPMSDTTKELVAQLAKAKIFARYDGTFDLVFYKKIETPGQKVVKALEETVEAQKPVVHGQKSKDRKKSPKKPR